MKILTAVALISTLLASCQKEVYNETPAPVPHPAMEYSNLQNREVKQGQSQAVDLDKDGRADFAFFVIHIGDPVLQQDKIRFLGGANIGSHLLTDPADNSPVLKKNDIVPQANMPPYEWFEIIEIFLAQKVIGMAGPPWWEGPWKNAENKYVAVKLVKNGLHYNGWIEITFDTAGERLTLHKAAICKEAGKEVKAGW